MPYKNQKDKNEWAKRDRIKNPDKYKKYHQTYRINNPKQPRIKKPAQTNEQKRRNNRNSYKRKKAAAHRRLGGSCSRCGESNPICLHIDHIKPILRGSLGLPNKGNQVTREAISEVLTMTNPHSTYQLLCANCHAIKSYNERHLYAYGTGYIEADEDVCDHQEDDQPDLFGSF